MFSVLLASSDGGGGGGFAAVAQLAFFGLIFVAMYFLLIRPQRRRQREAAALQSQLTEGDEVMLTSGLFGFVDGIEGDMVWVEVADNVTVRVTRGAIAKRIVSESTDVTASAPAADEPASDDDDK